MSNGIKNPMAEATGKPAPGCEAQAEGWGDRSGTSRDEILGHPYSSTVDGAIDCDAACVASPCGSGARDASAFIVCAGSPGTVIEKGERCPGFTGRAQTGLRTPAPTLTGVAAALVEGGRRISLLSESPAASAILGAAPPIEETPADPDGPALIVVEFFDDITGKTVGYDELRRAMLGTDQ